MANLPFDTFHQHITMDLLLLLPLPFARFPNEIETYFNEREKMTLGVSSSPSKERSQSEEKQTKKINQSKTNESKHLMSTRNETDALSNQRDEW